MISFEEYFEENENDKNKLNKKIKYYQRKTERLQSNWNSLRELLEKERDSEIFDYIAIYNCILDKMNELEGRDKE